MQYGRVISTMEITEIFENGKKGKVVYDENEDSYKLVYGGLCYDLCQALWDSYEGKTILIQIKEIK